MLYSLHQNDLILSVFYVFSVSFALLILHKLSLYFFDLSKSANEAGVDKNTKYFFCKKCENMMSIF